MQAETIGEISRHIELAAADMDLAFGGLAEGNDAWIEAVDERAEREEIERASWANIQTVVHGVAF